MSKATLMTPLYVSVAWTVMVTYQIFTQTAASTVLNSLHTLWPAAGEWLLLRMDMIVFVHAFAWVLFCRLSSHHGRWDHWRHHWFEIYC